MAISRNNTQLTSLFGYDTQRLVFSKPQVNSIPNSIPKIEYRRINIGTVNPDGSIGELIIETLPNLYSFGVSDILDQKTKEIVGHSFSICMWDSAKGATEEQKEWVETLNKIVDRVKEHLISVRSEIKRGDLELRDLKKFKAFYIKMLEDDITPNPNAAPVLNCKLDEYKKTDKKPGKILSVFRDETGKELDPLSLLKIHCYARAAVKIQEIFIGKGIMSLQIKLFEANIKRIDNLSRNLLGSREPTLPETKITFKTSEDESPKKNNTDDDEGSLSEDEDSRPSILPPLVENITLSSTPPQPVVNIPPPTPTKKVIRRK